MQWEHKKRNRDGLWKGIERRSSRFHCFRGACGCVPQRSAVFRWHASGKQGRFEQIGQDTSFFLRLVLFCIEADFDDQGRIFQHFSRSTRSCIWNFQNSLKICKILQNFSEIFKFSEISLKFCKKLKISAKICTSFENQVHHFVDLEKCWKMRPWSSKSASIQPRTSLRKKAVSWPNRETCMKDLGPGLPREY